FRTQATIPAEGIAAPELIPGIGWSDHWAFWQSDYPALMVTDTALYRYPHYHRAEDSADKINYEQMTRVVMGMQAVIKGLANS
ncbi:MAG: M28 family peptidase, partial [Pseudomonadota bacterium]|nr:M28 family peptidase [Pseudomonadota bacterium]